METQPVFLCRSKKFSGLKYIVIGIEFFSDDKECTSLFNSKESCKVKAPTVEHVARKRLVINLYGVDIVDLGDCDAIEDRYFRCNVTLCVNSDSDLVLMNSANL